VAAGEGRLATNLRNSQRVFGCILHQLADLAIVGSFVLQFKEREDESRRERIGAGEDEDEHSGDERETGEG